MEAQKGRAEVAPELSSVDSLVRWEPGEKRVRFNPTVTVRSVPADNKGRSCQKGRHEKNLAAIKARGGVKVERILAADRTRGGVGEWSGPKKSWADWTDEEEEEKEKKKVKKSLEVKPLEVEEAVDLLECVVVDGAEARTGRTSRVSRRGSEQTGGRAHARRMLRRGSVGLRPPDSRDFIYFLWTGSSPFESS